MVNYILKLELNFRNTMIFAVQYQSRDIALFLYEDHHRAGALLRDFPFLYPKYYASEEAWDDYRNFISVTIFSLFSEPMDKEIKDDLQYLAESMIEYKPAVNTKIQFSYDPNVCQYYSESDGNKMQFIQYMLSLCENQENIDFNEEAFNHLIQL